MAPREFATRLMTLLNAIYDAGSVTRAELETFIGLLNPIAPHVTEEINERLGNAELLAVSPWPTFDEAKCVENEIEIAVQVNGKVRGKIVIPADADSDAAIAAAKQASGEIPFLEGKTLVKELYVKGRLVNLVVR